MSTLVLTAAAQVGASLANSAKRTAISFAKRAISNAFDTRNNEGPRLESFLVQTSRDGAPMPRIYGRVRIAGQVIWASRLTETAKKESAGGKGGGPTQTNFSYSISFAIGLCEGEILSVNQIWANGAVLNTQGLSYRVYKGTADQMADPVMSAVEGGSVPAFRNTAYIVFEDFPLDEYGHRLPQINVEVIRVPKSVQAGPDSSGDSQKQPLETRVLGVNLLPSSGEYAYSPSIKEEIFGPGHSKALNMNNHSGASDFSKAIDQLENELPNCKSVSIIISWFGTDLRCGQCKIRPGVEDAVREIIGPEWSVGSDNRRSAFKVSKDVNNRPNFGGTPSDQSLIDAIRDLKSRGYTVSLYPFILMDIPPQNGLPNPYANTEQPAFPWRGRITCDPAPYRPGSPDKTSAIQSQIDAFFGTCSPSDFDVSNAKITYSGPSEYGFRRFILHYAKLAELAGGVERFIIGSEMRGVTTLRRGPSHYPAVTKLVSLADDVKSIVGAKTKLTYAADWSEYFGHHSLPGHSESGSGDVMFHLDPLWASPSIDAVGIDAYFPLSDWRDGTEHFDAESTENIYDLDYLESNLEGGEGYDWYYSNLSDRRQQIRTPITDGAVQKPWVFRYKDIRNWWLNPHYNRINGVEENRPTDWIPQSKPIWFTEVGCPAIDKGANQPNVFVDPKSSESFTPYFSNGGRDDLIQRRYIEAFTRYWAKGPDINPISALYNAPMVDLDALHIWCWDARPFPDFPVQSQVWSDGENWELGHWITGRTGLVPLADVIADLTYMAGIETFDVSKINGTLQGYIIDRPMSSRAALEPLSVIYGFNMVETARGLRFISIGAETTLDFNQTPLSGESLSEIEYVKDDRTLRVKDIRLHFLDPSKNYQLASVSARDLKAESVRVMDVNAPLVLNPSYARYVCDQILTRAHQSAQSLTLSLPLNALALEVGDLIRVDGNLADWRVEGIEAGAVQTVKARLETQRETGGFTPALSASTPTALVPPIWVGDPALVVLDIPRIEADTGPKIGVQLTPFARTRIASKFSVSDTETVLNRAVSIGTLLTVLEAGPIARWDYANVFEGQFNSVTGASHLNAVTQDALLNGANRFAVQTPLGWEILQAQNIELLSDGRYRFHTLLRGLFGSEAEMVNRIEAGAQIVKLDKGFTDLSLQADFLGEVVTVQTQTAKRTPIQHDFLYKARHLRPLAPVHGYLTQDNADHADSDEGDNVYVLSWIRQSRIDGQNWAAIEIPLGETREFYQVQLFSGAVVLETFMATTSQLTLTKAQIQNVDSIEVSQGSDFYGFGSPLKIPLDGLS